MLSKILVRGFAGGVALCCAQLLGQEGPFSTDDWPPTVDPDSEVHYVAVGEPLDPAGPQWFDGDLSILSGGDQATTGLTIGGKEGLKATSTYLNIADEFYEDWADNEEIDILMQIYGDAAVLDESGQPRDFTFLLGTLPFDPPYLTFEVGGQLPLEAKNRQWNWVLFRVPNGIRADGERFVGSIGEVAAGTTQAGGVNRGTIRMENVTGLTVRVVAFGERGAFGEPEAINRFAVPETCDPEPVTNLAWVDIANDQADHLQVINSGNQRVEFMEAGPSSDRRRAVKPQSELLNFGVVDNYLGLPCNDVRNLKVCVEFYDDPELAGSVFGPEDYPTDGQGGIATYPESQRHTLLGTGEWIRRAWSIAGVSMAGVETGDLTGGPRFRSTGGAVAVSRFDLGVFRTGDHPMAGIDPLPDCYQDPRICTEAYGNYVEWNVATGEEIGLGPGSSTSDQEMIIEEAGPSDDRRMAIRPAMDDGTPGFPHIYTNFSILGESLGPSTQDNAHIAICVTYYDDPDLIGATFRPGVYKTDRSGTIGFAFTAASSAVPLTGSGEWRDAYFEIPDLKLLGVNQGPQAAARFHYTGKIAISRVRYGIIRPCGPNALVNPLEECQPLPVDLNMTVSRLDDQTVRLAWPDGPLPVSVESTSDLNALEWTDVPGEVTLLDGMRSLDVEVSEIQFYRLRQ